MTFRRYTDDSEGRGSGGGTATAERPRVTEQVREDEFVTTQRGGRSLARGLLRGVLVLSLAYALVLVQMFLGLRLAFQLEGANPNNDVVDAVYEVGDQLAEPFQGIMATETVDGGVFEQASPGLFDPANAIAMGVYFAAGVLAIGLILALTRAPSARGTAAAVKSGSGQRAAYEH